MIVNLVAKYGVVPKTVFPETHTSSASRTMNRMLTSFLRQYACELREARLAGATDDELKAKFPAYMEKVGRALL